MTEFLVTLLLLFMIFPALLVLFFAPRGWFAVVWNLFWFYIMASAGNFLIPNYGWFLGALFATLYLWRVIRRPQEPKRVDFGHVYVNLQRSDVPPEFTEPFHQNTSSAERSQIIDVEASKQN